MSGGERREQILAAALATFAAGGYAGTTTDQVARAAGVSQPYVVRLFGSKRQLFLELYRQVAERIVVAMSAVDAGPDAAREMGDAYVALMGDRDLLRVLMHGFVAAEDPEIGRIARHTLGEVFRLFEARVPGTGEEREDGARTFVSMGMLINVLLASDALAHAGEDAGLDALLRCVFDRATWEALEGPAGVGAGASGPGAGR